jgi:hypothetical protein
VQLAADKRPVAALPGQMASLNQALDRLADRRPADLEANGQLVFVGQLVADDQPAAVDLIKQIRADLLDQ